MNPTHNFHPQIFKAYDIRGKYPSEINEKVVSEITQALVRYFVLKAKNYKLKAKLVVACDARLSSPALYRAVLKAFSVQRSAARKGKAKTLNANRYTLYPAGIATTPMFYFLVNKLKASGGIMVTASHNPKEYNGLKIVGKNAQPVSGNEILKIMNYESR